jgi:aryl-alcohol dehydrogenase-like predicted oxidoreductase
MKGKMQYRQHNDMKLSEIGVGCYSLSGAYGSVDPEDIKAVLRRAHELGVNFFDTADTYGEVAERMLGQAINPFRDEVYIATKVGVREGVKPNLTAEYVRNACQASLARLQTEIIDLYQVHFDDLETPVEETVSALDDLKKAGTIRHYGLGHLSPQKIKKYIESGEIFSILMEFSAVTPEARSRILPICRENRVGAIAFSVTGRGVLTGKYKKDVTFEAGDIRILDPLFQRERFESALRIADKCQEISSKYGKTPVQAAIAWVLSHSEVVCALTGPSTIPHLEENIGGSGWCLSSEDLKELEDFLRKEEDWLFHEQSQSIQKILSEKLNPVPSQAFIDLIYVVETSILIGLASEQELLPTFMQLYALRDTLSKEATPQLSSIKAKLEETISIPPNTKRNTPKI